MTKRLAALLSVAALVALSPLGGTQARAAASNPITILHCFITQPKPLSKTASGTQITYINSGHKTAKDITFQVAYRNAESNFKRKVTDVGTFGPGAQIDHHFDLYNDVTYAGKQVQSCTAVEVKYSDGSIWRG
jgi:hypothetical protein